MLVKGAPGLPDISSRNLASEGDDDEKPMALPCIIASPANSSNIPWDPIDPMLVQGNGQIKNITVLYPYSYHHHA